MGILQLPTPIPGTQGTLPTLKFMVSTDPIDVVVAAGYLNQVSLEGYSISKTDIIQLLYNFNQQTNVGSYTVCTVSVSNGIIQLHEVVNEGNVVLPTTANHIATYRGTDGVITENAPTAINSGNIQAGLSGVAGTLASYPAAANSGSLKIAAVSNASNYVTTISNEEMGQDTIITIPDPGASSAKVILDATIISALSPNIGGSGANPPDILVTGLTPNHIVQSTVFTTDNDVNIVATQNGIAGRLSIEFSADPGPNAYITYFAYLPPV